MSLKENIEALLRGAGEGVISMVVKSMISTKEIPQDFKLTDSQRDTILRIMEETSRKNANDNFFTKKLTMNQFLDSNKYLNFSIVRSFCLGIISK